MGLHHEVGRSVMGEHEKTKEGQNVIFLVSQPRSGSTLLQKMLAEHPAVHTTSEPWVMLPPAYSLREDGMEATYDWNLAQTGLKTFLDELPRGRKDYVEGLSRMFGYLYRQALKDKKRSLFLDKTPRYYLILSELRDILPKSKIVLLFRNPLSVLSSIVRTWVKPNWLSLANYENDFLEAPTCLLEAKSRDDSVASVQYEDLVQRPAQEIKRLCEEIGLEFVPSMVEYGEEGDEKWTLGDSETVYQHTKPKTFSLRKWANTENAQEWRLLYEYAEILGADTFEELGYDYNTCMSTLQDDHPRESELQYTVSMDWLLRNGGKNRSRWRYHAVQALDRVREKGVLGAPRYLWRRFVSRVGS
jgi:hypothetical protein